MARILVVDDEEGIRRVLHQLFEYEDHEVRSAVGGDDPASADDQRGQDDAVARRELVGPVHLEGPQQRQGHAANVPARLIPRQRPAAGLIPG